MLIYSSLHEWSLSCPNTIIANVRYYVLQDRSSYNVCYIYVDL